MITTLTTGLTTGGFAILIAVALVLACILGLVVYALVGRGLDAISDWQDRRARRRLHDTGAAVIPISRARRKRRAARLELNRSVIGRRDQGSGRPARIPPAD